ncbi:MAG TPA: methylmalonyl-CoA mutase family protein [Bacillota bacterium]|nr:methylmalonyl-CoA mutase family protein [Bacillota bacterium]HOP69794.1 methylmalonyl-CoA mutase family protein [Bacillota bacterium]HPT34799.1 methylmalonyl-CoA mutase family protein [Bacillota bacterium]HQD06614.1 methylmalonyl-CoA mutase family protein [Bacillota bacterium]
MDRDECRARLERARQAWEEKLKQALEKMPERKEFKLDSGIELERLYDPFSLGEHDYLERLGYPGEYPFTRGIQPTMYRGRLWTMRQYAGFGTAEETNERFRYLLKQGQTGLSVAFDLPTQIGYDSDHPLARGEVGRVGVAIDSLEDMEILLREIPLDRVSTSMTINSPAAVLLAMYLAVAEKQGVPPEKLNGTIQNDILKEYVARGTYIFPPRESMRLVVDIFEFAGKHVPQWNTISISGYHIREAGSTAVQEVAFTLSNAIAYVEAALQAGLEVDQFGPRLSFFFNAHLNFFEEIAKFRAARRIWARLMKERFGAKNPRSMMLRFHTQTAGCTLTAQQPDVNVVRVAFQALSAVLGGTQSLHTNSRDEALALPSEHAALLALRTQQVIGYEIGVTDTVDPLGGSYFLEALTDRMEQEILAYIQRIDQMGGAVAAIEQGYMQQEIQESAYRYQKEIESGERVVIGVNRFTEAGEQPVELLKVDPAVGERQINRLKEVRRRRDQRRVAETLQQLRKAAQSSDNLMPYILEAVKAYATMGEICGVLREVFGEYRPQVAV